MNIKSFGGNDTGRCAGPVAAAYLLALILGGCGGGGGGGDSLPNAAPLAVDDSRTMLWNTASGLDVTNNDSDPNGDKLSVSAVGTPSHGTASIAANSSSIVYTPQVGRFGTDLFTYTVSDGRGGSSQATVAVTVQAKITLSGQAVDAPLAGAKITVQVGTASTVVIADDQGRWSAPLTLDDPEALVSLTAQGTGAQSGVKLVSVVGRALEVASLVDASGNVTADSLPATRITQMTTATAALAFAANGGALPTTAAAWDAARMKVDPTAAVSMAAAIKAVADGGATLPAEVTDTWALVGDPAKYATWFAALAKTIDGAYTKALTAMGADPALRVMPWPLPSAAEPKVAYDLVSVSPCCASLGMRAELHADGTALFNDQPGKWKLVNGAVVASYDTPIVSTISSSGTNANGYQVDGTVTVTGMTLTVLSGNSKLGVATMQAQSTVTWSDPTYVEPVASVSPIYYTYINVASTRVPAASDIAGHAYSGLKVPGYELLDSDTADFFGDGAGRMRRTGLTFTWMIDADALVLTYAGHAKQSIRIVSSSATEQRWETFETPLAPIAGDAASLRLTQSLVVAADVAEPALTATRLSSGRWICDFTPPFSEGLTIVLNPDGTGTRFDVPVTWTIVNATLEMRSVSSGALRESWQLVTDAGNSLYFQRTAYSPTGAMWFHRLVRLDKAV